MLKSMIKKLIARTPYRVVRGAPNRFQAISETLQHLHDLGYRPRVIVDGGAHLGDFSLEASLVFPDAVIHMVEPQPACQDRLNALAASRGFHFHPLALADRPGPLRMWADEVASTGASIVLEADPVGSTVPVQATTLDRVLGDLKPDDRAFVKLDLQGHEPEALRGGLHVMARIEVMLIELSFFDEARGPSVASIVGMLDHHGFELYEMASLSGRSRDDRLKQGDFVFVRRGTPLLADPRWS